MLQVSKPFILPLPGPCLRPMAGWVDVSSQAVLPLGACGQRDLDSPQRSPLKGVWCGLLRQKPQKWVGQTTKGDLGCSGGSWGSVIGFLLEALGPVFCTMTGEPGGVPTAFTTAFFPSLLSCLSHFQGGARCNLVSGKTILMGWMLG